MRNSRGKPIGLTHTMPVKQVAVKDMPVELWELVKGFAEKRDRHIKDVVVSALLEYLQREIKS